MQTRLHSSRMCTARALTVSPSMLCAGGSPSGGCLARLYFLHLFVILFTLGVCLSACWDTPGRRPPGGGTSPKGDPLEGNPPEENPGGQTLFVGGNEQTEFTA